ncbi:MAG: hypothetical protein MUP03_04425 [Anaerolineales bacterium]|jgi:hypothetical protein|nr:hypothetical protein [Anaerolineales bacterium]
MSETGPVEKHQTNKTTLAAIIVAGIVCIICILACTSIAIAFLMNPPW